ncbi:MAG: helix-hairpin-helix domain-containing protein [Candidatus Poseidonia sp.]|uniref:helix-hairpin-helix domain-containing protein n=1 Tax=Poseidonia sp. TaxID=2666344 RepID=UPI0030BF7007|nr:helix-hairpin-helix domain-containing protein [Poseidonia sp.]
MKKPLCGSTATGGRLKSGVKQGHSSGIMAGKAPSSPKDLTSLPGVGAATAKKLASAKIDSIAKLAKATPKSLQKAGLSVAVAKKTLAAAKAATKVKKSATKVKDSVKGSTKKAATAAKKKATSAASKAKKSTQKVMKKSQDVAEDVVEKTKAVSSLKTKSESGRKGPTINVPRSVKDMPWFKKK